jgi:hypothetical protein
LFFNKKEKVVNKLIFRLLSVFVMFILVLGSSYATYGLSIPQSQVTTLPVTEGFRANPIGGQGGTVYAVTNTNDSGSGNGIPVASGGFWYRGNTHTHSQLPALDDRSTIAGWYKTAGYDFLMISDHNYDVNQQNYCPDNLSTATFLMICGVELSNSRHTTALGINQYISGESSLQDATTRTLNAGGIPILNHPQDPVVSASTFLSTVGLNHIEVVNGGRLDETPATEILWDQILSASNGRLAYGVASDDNHYSQSNVGRGWIVVKAQSLTKADILASVRAGNFYASTGIVLNDYVVNLAAKTITVDSQNGNTITFIGNNGAVLQSVSAAKATYLVTGLEKYVRAKITNTAGKMAWTQPIYVTSFGEITPTPTTPLTPPSITNTPTLTRTPTFDDVPLTHWAYSYIERLYNAGITNGCGTAPLIYCPNNTATRAEMAVFLLRSMHGSGFTPPAVGGSTGFSDVPITHWAAAWIKQLAAEGITTGCGTGLYCPNATVTRAEMAVFLLRGKHSSGYTPPLVGISTGFSDVPITHWAAAWIKQLAAEGITSGCGPNLYCPSGSVTRAEMAAFLVRAFSLP